jgi:signal transduction histidine kinase
MRLATKSMAIALTVYVALLGSLAFWMDYQLRSLARGLMEGTARLLGGEVAALISESAVEQLLAADSAARQRLEQLIFNLTSRSEVVASLTVVDATGRVVASKDIEPGRQLADPGVIFQGDKRPQLVSSEVPLGGSKYHLFVPLLRENNLVGYLRLSISSKRIESLYRRAQQQLIFMGAVGLGVVATLGLLFHFQLSRFADTLTRGLEAALHGDAVPPPQEPNEFAGVFDTARRVGQELSAAREKSVDAERRFGALMKVMETGLLLVGPDKTLDFANAAARELLGCPGSGELERRWHEKRSLLETGGAGGRAGSARMDVDIPYNERVNRLRLEWYARGDGDRDGWLILVKNREILKALEKELRLAIQMRGFAHFYRASVHDLKAPLNAMVLNLQLLKSTLSKQSATLDGDTLERQTRCMSVLGEEITRLDRSLGTILTQAAPPSDTLQQFDLRELINDLATLLNPQARHQQVALTTEMPEQAVPFTGHRDGLKQALLNIAINALESMPQGGRMDIDLTATEGRASISIRDTGPGIPPEVLGEIYKMHFTTKDGGTGIGLYVARSVVESHGGEVRVDTKLGQGTCFQIDLPLSAV